MKPSSTIFPIIGITGNSGSGKTTAARILSGFGGYIADADKISHSVIKKGGGAYNEIIGANLLFLRMCVDERLFAEHQKI